MRYPFKPIWRVKLRILLFPIWISKILIDKRIKINFPLEIKFSGSSKNVKIYALKWWISAKIDKFFITKANLKVPLFYPKNTLNQNHRNNSPSLSKIKRNSIQLKLPPNVLKKFKIKKVSMLSILKTKVSVKWLKVIKMETKIKWIKGKSSRRKRTIGYWADP